MRSTNGIKRIPALLLLILSLCAGLNIVTAAQADDYVDFSDLFDQHGANMLLIDADSGMIVAANQAAVKYYGYSKEQLLSMQINDINTLSTEETVAEMNAAAEQRRNYFLFQHRLSSGEVRYVEAYSYPVNYLDHRVLFSIIYDVNDRILLERRANQRSVLIFILVGLISVMLLLFLILSIRSRNKMKTANDLFRTFLDANGDCAFLLDDKLNYLFSNRSTEALYGFSSKQMVDRNDAALKYPVFTGSRLEVDLEVIKTNAPVRTEIEWNQHIFDLSEFPVRMANGRTGVGAYIRDVTQQRGLEKQRDLTAMRHAILADVLSRIFQGLQDELDYVLHQTLSLTESKYGYIYLYDEDRQEFTLNSWSNDVMPDCKVAEKQTVYSLEKTGIWGEAVRQRKPIVVNDFAAPNLLKKGYPAGHVSLTRFLSLPITIDGRIVAVIGLANKPSDYDENDVVELSLLMNGIWNNLKRREVQKKLAYERSRYLQTLVSIGDSVMVVDRDGRVEMLNLAAEKLTGWSSKEASGLHYRQVFAIRHEHESERIDDPIAAAFETGTVQELSNHAVLTSKNGEEFFLEDSAAPILNDSGEITGVVLVFRDVTAKKKTARTNRILEFSRSPNRALQPQILERRAATA